MKRQNRKVIAVIAVIAGAALALTGCASSSSLSGGGSSSKTSMVIGSANFPENVTLAYLYGQALAADGVTVTYKVNIGERAAYIPALEKGEINFIPEYAGSILSFLDKTANQASGADVKAALDAKVPAGLKALELSEAADSDSLNVTPEFAKANGLKSISDLSKLSSFVLSANPAFETRADGVRGLKSIYGLSNFTFTGINDGGGSATLKALIDNTSQVVDIYSTTPSILDNKLVTLEDPKNLFASQQVVPLVTSKKATAKVTALLNKVSAKLTTKDLLEFNKRTGGDEKADPKTVAADWLKANGFTK